MYRFCLGIAVSMAAFGQVSPTGANELLNEYCVVCHSAKGKTAGLSLEKRDLTKVAAESQDWEKVVRKVRAGQMPPKGMPRPENGELDKLAGWLETTLDRAAAARPNPGRTLIHRLNRIEYANAMKDLLGLSVDVSPLLPPDDSADGFDNMAQKLTISPVLLERYLSASAKITRLAVGDPATAASAAIYRPAADLSQDKHIEGLPLGTVGGLLTEHYFPLDGEYTFETKLSRSILAVVHGLEDRHGLEITLDGERMKLAYFGGTTDDTRSHLNGAAIADEIDARFTFKTKVKAGPHQIGVAFLRTSLAQTAEVWQQYLATTLDANETKGVPHVDKVVVTGPFNATGPGDTPSRRKIFVCRPTAGKDELPCARRILTTLARRAYRRPVSEADMEDILSFYQRGRNNKGNFEQGIQTGIRRIISGPEFVFRAVNDPATAAVNAPYRISELELASRLSFFLWSTIPDDELYQTASLAKLRAPGVLEAQVRRMMGDARSNALVTSFAEQWLHLRNLKAVVPDPGVFPDFDDNLRQALIRETELLFESVVKEDRNVVDLLDADYTFVNGRLARHYGIPTIYGDRFRRVPVTDPARRGLLGQGSILTLTSVAIRTSPVERGKWILTNLIGTPPPPPPPNIPALKERTGVVLSMRDRMAEHRANPACSSCHNLMDPIGFALENFDAVGRWRTKDGGAKIDPKDIIFDGSTVDGANGLRQFLLGRKEVFVQTVVEKLMTYALGRAVEHYDMPAVRKVMREAAKDNYKFSAIVLGIVTSAPFQMRMKAAADPALAAENR